MENINQEELIRLYDKTSLRGVITYYFEDSCYASAMLDRFGQYTEENEGFWPVLTGSYDYPEFKLPIEYYDITFEKNDSNPNDFDWMNR